MRPEALFLALLLALGIAGGLAACGSEAPAEDPAFDLGGADESGDPSTPGSTDPGMSVARPGADDPPGPSPGEDPDSTPPGEDTATRSPENLAASALDALGAAYQELGRLLESEDDPKAVRQGWSEIKDKVVQSMKEVARHRLRLDAKGRAKLRKEVMDRRPDALRPHFEHVERAVRRFQKTDTDLATDIAGAHNLVELALGG